MAEQGNTTVANPFEALAALDKRCKARALSLPVKEVATNQWVGTGFRINDYYCVTPVGDINEIMLLSDMARVPRSKPWVLGISNVRGSLLPIIDLGGFLFNRMGTPKRDSRIIVLRHNGLDVGLLVDEVLGIQHFPSFPADPSSIDVESPFPELVTGLYNNDGAIWWVINILKLCSDPEFLQVSV